MTKNVEQKTLTCHVKDDEIPFLTAAHQNNGVGAVGIYDGRALVSITAHGGVCCCSLAKIKEFRHRGTTLKRKERAFGTGSPTVP